MKKIYLAPDTKSMKIALMSIIAASPNSAVSGVQGSGLPLDDADDMGSGDVLGSRRGGFWDDEY